MDLGIEGRNALVTAASRGLGKAIAFRLSQEGANVAICARGRDQLLKSQSEILEATGGRVEAYVADVREAEQPESLVAKAAEELGTIEILVCNAGGPPSGTFEDFTPEDYRKAVELNLLSTVRLCYAAIPFMKMRNWGRIVTLTSVSARQPLDTLILSNTARAGVLGFSKSLSNQLAPLGITVNSVLPGYTRTERVEELARDFERKGRGTVEEFYRRIGKTIPMQRLGRPVELAAAVAFLCSESAGYITGASLQVDGGFIKSI